MRLQLVECRDFRCIESIRFEPEPGVNVLRGANAQGKTSLLEAVSFAATSKSPRTNTEEELVRYGESGFRVRIAAERRDREVAIEAFWWQNAKRFRVNGVPMSRMSDVLGKIQAVFFSPEDVELVRGAATPRRRFLDMEISQISPAYLGALQQYRQALRQRNEVLRNSRPDPALLDVWDAQLVKHGVILMEERRTYIGDLARCAAEAYGNIAGGETLEITYAPDAPEPEALAETLARARDLDLRNRLTRHGPHRDDFTIQVTGHAARQFASQGQQKTAALALKLAEMELVRARVGEYPVLMLDEVLAELDEARARRLFEFVPAGAQCLVTTTELEPRPGVLGALWANYRIEKGRLTKI